MKSVSISSEKAHAICIVKTMAKAGYFLSRETEKEAWFPSPFRSETQASFKIIKQYRYVFCIMNLKISMRCGQGEKDDCNMWTDIS